MLVTCVAKQRHTDFSSFACVFVRPSVRHTFLCQLLNQVIHVSSNPSFFLRTHVFFPTIYFLDGGPKLDKYCYTLFTVPKLVFLNVKTLQVVDIP